MSHADWTAPKTEEGLQEVLRRIAACRSAGDTIETGYGLLSLAHLVKWVRSDTDADPFERSYQLAREADNLFREVGHAPGLMRALIAAVPFAPRKAQEAMMQEAQQLAETAGSDGDLAQVLAARARGAGLRDRGAAGPLYRQALALFEQAGDKSGVAQCLFGLSIVDGSPAEKRDVALEAAQAYREIEDFRHASMSVVIALMNAEELEPITSLEPLVWRGLEDARRADDGAWTAPFHQRLAAIARAKGDDREATEFTRLADLSDGSLGLSARERWEGEAEALAALAALAESTENTEVAADFQEGLRQLLEDGPPEETA